MTRERARTERRDLDKERGEPVAGGAARGGPRALRADGPAAPRLVDPAEDPDHERRRRRVARAARAQAGARPDRRHDRRRAGHEPERRRPPEDADAAAARPGADARRRLARATRSTAARPTPSASPSSATSGTASTSSRPASTTGRTSATTSPTPGPCRAAMEAVINDCPAFAISQEYYEHPDFTLAAVAATIVARNILEHGLSRGRADQRQRPGRRRSRSATGIEVTRLGRRVYQDQLVERLDPRGIPYFWIGGPPPSGLAIEGTDFHAVVNRRIAITPIHLDLTGRRLLRRLKTWAVAATGRERRGARRRRREIAGWRVARGARDRARDRRGARDRTALSGPSARSRRPL